MKLNIDTIKNSFEQVRPISDDVANKFYEFLWEDYPPTKTFFNDIDMPKQKKALIASLAYIVNHLDDQENLVDYLRAMGKRHVQYGTQDDHYDLVGLTLIKTFKFFFKEAWTKDLEREWITAFNIISSFMIEGAHEKEIDSDKNLIRKEIQEVCSTLIEDILEEEMQGQFKKQARQKVRSLLLELFEEEFHDLIGSKKSTPRIKAV